MANFAKSVRPPRTFTREEALALLDASGRYAATFRDHMLFSIAFGTGLRIHEALALKVGQLYTPAGSVREYVTLTVFKGCKRKSRAKGRGEDGKPETQEIWLNDILRAKLRKLYQLKARHGERLD